MITEINQSEWDSVVRSFSNYDVFYLHAYSKAFMHENSKNGIPILLFYENGNDKAINVIFKRDIALDENLSGKIESGKYFDIVTPYGYGGFLGAVNDWNKLNEEYTDYCLKNNYVCEFVRFELFTEYYKHYNGEIETRTHNIVRNLEPSIDEIWMDFKQKVRKNVKRANSFKLSCIIENENKHIDDFLRIYYGTMNRKNAEKDYYFSQHFYEELNAMKDNLMYFHVVYEGKIVSTELIIYGAQNCYSYLGGTDKEYFDVRPNDFLKYEIIKWAKKKGLKNFVLGGGYGADDGIYQYKLCLAPHGQQEFFIGRRIFNQKLYDKLVTLCQNKELNEKYFPLYRS